MSAESNHQFHWMPALYSGWLHSMRDVQTEPGADCSAVTGVAGDTNIVNISGQLRANCSGAVAEIVPGSTPVAIPGDPSWVRTAPLVLSHLSCQLRPSGSYELVHPDLLRLRAADFSYIYGMHEGAYSCTYVMHAKVIAML